MAGDEARRSADLLLAIEGVEQRGADVSRPGGQRVEPVAVLAGQRRRRHVQVTREMERHGTVQQAARGFDRLVRIGCGAADPLERLMQRIGIGEDVVRSLPVGMLVGGAETRHPERRRIGECLAEVGGGSPGARRGLQRIDDCGRFVGEKAFRRAPHDPTSRRGTATREQERQLERGRVTQGDQVDRLAPRRRFLGAAGLPPSGRRRSAAHRPHAPSR